MPRLLGCKSSLARQNTSSWQTARHARWSHAFLLICSLIWHIWWGFGGGEAAPEPPPLGRSGGGTQRVPGPLQTSPERIFRVYVRISRVAGCHVPTQPGEQRGEGATKLVQILEEFGILARRLALHLRLDHLADVNQHCTAGLCYQARRESLEPRGHGMIRVA